MINWFYLHLRAIGHALRRLVAQFGTRIERNRSVHA